MPWMETCAVGERMRFVVAAGSGEESVSRLCRRFGISRKTGNKWLERYDRFGAEGLKDRSRRPRHSPHAVAEDIVERCLAVRRRHSSWGPRKVRAWLLLDDPATVWPAASTIGDMFDRAGLTVRRRRRHRTPAYSAPFAACGLANDVWTIDFKGWFRTGDGRRCDPLTVLDACARYLLRCQVLPRLDFSHVWPVLEAVFREYGLPYALRSDNGPPFASGAAGGLSRLAVCVIQAGVVPERIAPGHPEQNGRHERLHLTLQQDTASPPAATLRAQSERFRRFQRIYNEERPHEALDQTPPARHYQPSPRPWDGVLRSPALDEAVEKRHVRKDGTIKWHGRRAYINENLAGEWLGLEEIADGLSELRYGPITLGHLKPRGSKLIRKAADRGLVDNAKALPTPPPPQQPQHQENK
jgi:putative transposase